MSTIRRTPVRGSALSLSSRVGDLMMRRRADRLATPRKETVTTSDDPEVVSLPVTDTPLSDFLSKARFESRPPRTGEYLHVSDLLSRCVRLIALRERYELEAPRQSLGLSESLTYAQGDAIHDVLKARATRGSHGNVWGTWSCRCGTTKTLKPCLLSEVDQNQLCNACKTPRNRYEEVPMRDKELGIVGTPDLILYLQPLKALYVTELKSIAHDAWKELVRPLPDHVLQVVFYWYLMQRKGYKLAKNVSILYATKGWLFTGDPYKEFVIDAESSLPRLTPYLEEAAALKSARAGGDLPSRICPTQLAPDARKCEACRVCFKGSDSAPKTIDIRKALTRRGA